MPDGTTFLFIVKVRKREICVLEKFLFVLEKDFSLLHIKIFFAHISQSVKSTTSSVRGGTRYFMNMKTTARTMKKKLTA